MANRDRQILLMLLAVAGALVALWLSIGWRWFPLPQQVALHDGTSQSDVAAKSPDARPEEVGREQWVGEKANDNEAAGGRILGIRVVDSIKLDPVAAVEVVCHIRWIGAEAVDTVIAGVTGSDGVFGARLPDTPVVCRIRYRAHGSPWIGGADRRVEPTCSQVTLVMPPLGQIHGTIMDGQTRSPLVGVRVAVSDGAQVTASDAGGRYSLSAPAGEMVELTHSTEGYGTQSAFVMGQDWDGAVARPRVVMQPEVALRGRVVGAPLAPLRIVASSWGSAGIAPTWQRDAGCAADGTFLVRGLPALELLRVSVWEGADCRMALSVAPRGQSLIDLGDLRLPEFAMVRLVRGGSCIGDDLRVGCEVRCESPALGGFVRAHPMTHEVILRKAESSRDVRLAMGEIVVGGSGPARRLRRVKLPGESLSREIRLEYEEMESASCLVRDGRGQPSSDIEVCVGRRPHVALASGRTGRDGRVTLGVGKDANDAGALLFWVSRRWQRGAITTFRRADPARDTTLDITDPDVQWTGTCVGVRPEALYVRAAGDPASSSQWNEIYTRGVDAEGNWALGLWTGEDYLLSWGEVSSMEWPPKRGGGGSLRSDRVTGPRHIRLQ